LVAGRHRLVVVVLPPGHVGSVVVCVVVVFVFIFVSEFVFEFVGLYVE